MRGLKRAAVSESFSEPNQSPFKNAKPVEGSLSPASLDKQRAELARKHVRALNNQFVSWVQIQLKNHPDELWEDGMNDYISHASNILKIRERGESIPESRGPEKKPVAELKNTDLKSVSNNSLFTSNNQPGLFSNNQSSSFASSHQSVTPVSIPAKRDSPDEADAEDEPPQPSSPSVKRPRRRVLLWFMKLNASSMSSNTNETIKFVRDGNSNDPTDKGAWKDKGTGNLYIKCKEGVDKGTKESKPTILVRNDVGKLLLNALLYTGIKTSAQKNALVAIFHSSEDSNENVTPRTFLIRTKTAEARDKLATAIQEYAPSS
ncbi:hypothetical protein Bca52824_001678 [Brassica carinata]|uniref:RanBD1 domain-containing protein n=1 Tax=Brassica carinata TaxID=52824 RepID=A0A8X7WGI5_BRACI|nr:hypothetical protein Bca52824_001678 [Brassica carinata]